MFAWILKMKPLKRSRSGGTGPSLVSRGTGAGAIFTKSSKKIWTPKLVMAEPKNRGLS
ncbi:hypothetical protein D3C86_2072310 [compost metagenome]